MQFPLHFIVTVILLLFFLSHLFTRYLSLFIVRRPRSKSSHQSVLHLNAYDEFRITIFSDLHYGEEEDGWGIDQDLRSSRVMNDVLDIERPDFVVLIDGDLITGENTFLSNSTKYLDVIVRPLVDRNLSWASTYGNHDSQFNLSRRALFAEEEKYEGSYTRAEVAGGEGVTNYYLLIYPPSRRGKGDGDEDSPAAILWFFDSQGGAHFQGVEEYIPNFVPASVVSWFTSTSSHLAARFNKTIPSLAFVHIPPSAFLALQETVFPERGDESAVFPGLNDDVPLAAQGQGQGEGRDVGFMQALIDTPGLHSVYSGHDHGDAWCANWPADVTGVVREEGVEGPKLCFGKHSGYGGYGRWRRGARCLSLSFQKGSGESGGYGEMEVETWVRMEGGEVVNLVKLNRTYGRDLYAVEDGEEVGDSRITI
ncbi:unnamed protein product [Diplocarpon coronariae]